MSTKLLKLNNISKKYYFHSPKSTIVERFSNRKGNSFIWALKDINLNVNKGERIALIGPNGSGKTTLLKVITGITTPTLGNIVTQGRIASIIEIGGGFHPELTGKENIILNGLIVGMSLTEIKEKSADIIAFADIKSFINAPLYTYSEGMKLRLGFSIIINSDPDVLVLDDVFALADRKFNDKATKRTKEMVARGMSLVISTHFMPFLRYHCDRIIWLEKGRIKEEGDPSLVVHRYIKSNTL